MLNLHVEPEPSVEAVAFCRHFEGKSEQLKILQLLKVNMSVSVVWRPLDVELDVFL